MASFARTDTALDRTTLAFWGSACPDSMYTLPVNGASPCAVSGFAPNATRRAPVLHALNLRQRRGVPHPPP